METLVSKICWPNFLNCWEGDRIVLLCGTVHCQMYEKNRIETSATFVVYTDFYVLSQWIFQMVDSKYLLVLFFFRFFLIWNSFFSYHDVVSLKRKKKIFVDLWFVLIFYLVFFCESSLFWWFFFSILNI